MRIAMLREIDATIMFLNAIGILSHRIDENWSEHEMALIVERDKNSHKLTYDMTYVFEKNGRLLRIE